MRSLWKNRNLIYQLSKRDLLARYRGSMLGVVWALLGPLMMLAIYTVVFGFIFEGRFDETVPNTTSRLDFCLALFCGLNIFALFADAIVMSPKVILANPSYVTKVVFPLEVLPVVNVISAFIQFLFSSVPLLLALLVVHRSLHWTSILMVPLVMVLLLFALGFCWLVASLGVFLRDIGNLIPPLLQVLFFASAIFYPMSKVPEGLRWVVEMNPLAQIISGARDAMVFGNVFNFGTLGILAGIGLVVCWGGYWFFNKTKPAFADVM